VRGPPQGIKRQRRLLTFEGDAGFFSLTPLRRTARAIKEAEFASRKDALSQLFF
jgi:hypothetical protein